MGEICKYIDAISDMRHLAPDSLRGIYHAFGRLHNKNTWGKGRILHKIRALSGPTISSNIKTGIGTDSPMPSVCNLSDVYFGKIIGSQTPGLLIRHNSQVIGLLKRNFQDLGNFGNPHVLSLYTRSVLGRTVTFFGGIYSTENTVISSICELLRRKGGDVIRIINSSKWPVIDTDIFAKVLQLVPRRFLKQDRCNLPERDVLLSAYDLRRKLEEDFAGYAEVIST